MKKVGLVLTPPPCDQNVNTSKTKKKEHNQNQSVISRLAELLAYQMSHVGLVWAQNHIWTLRKTFKYKKVVEKHPV